MIQKTFLLKDSIIYNNRFIDIESDSSTNKRFCESITTPSSSSLDDVTDENDERAFLCKCIKYIIIDNDFRLFNHIKSVLIYQHLIESGNGHSCPKCKYIRHVALYYISYRNYMLKSVYI